VKEFHVSSDLQFNVTAADPAIVEEVLRKFEAELDSKNPDVRHDALHMLSTAAPTYFHDEALRLARDPDPFVVAHVVGALGRLNTPEDRVTLAETITSRKATNDNELAACCDGIE